jgi:hypothetical protein
MSASPPRALDLDLAGMSRRPFSRRLTGHLAIAAAAAEAARVRARASNGRLARDTSTPLPASLPLSLITCL